MIVRTLLTALLMVAACGDIFLAVYSRRRGHLPGASALAALMAAIGCYCLGYAGELSCDTLEAMLAWSRVQYWGIVLLAPLWTIVALRYSGRGQWLTPAVMAGLFIIPLVTLTVRMVPALSHHLYRHAWIDTAAPFPMLAFTPGPWYWVNITYTNLALVAGTLLIAVKPRNHTPIYRRQDLVMLLGSCFPWAAFLVYLTGILPWSIDLVPIALSLTGPFYAWGILSNGLFDLAPVARETLFDRMREPVLVFDGLGRFVDCNHAAAHFDMEGRVGLAARQALEHLPGLCDIMAHTDAERDEPLWQDPRDARYWQVGVSRISRADDEDRGRLVVLRDVTGLKTVEQALRRSEEQYRFVTENVSDVIWQLDTEMRFVFVNSLYGTDTNLYGYSREEMIGMPLFALLTPEGIAEVTRKQAEREELVKRGETGDASRFEVQARRKDGRYIWVEVNVTPYFDENGTVSAYVGVTRDISGRRESEDTIRKLSTIVEQSPVAIVITDRGGTIEYVNPSFCRQTGFAAEEAHGATPRILKSGEHPPEFYAKLWHCIQSGDVWRGVLHNRKKTGELFWESASISPIRNGWGEITHFVAIKEDVTERTNLLERLLHMAHHDELTGLPNRTLFFDRLKQAMALAKRDGRRFGLFYLDLDGFKAINDVFGHEAGDHVLTAVAGRLTACVRASDTVARMGGDEFTLILTNLARVEDAALVAGHILAAIEQPFALPDGRQARLGTSIGISVFPEDADTPDRLLTCADAAMYRAKRGGKSAYCFGCDTAADQT